MKHNKNSVKGLIALALFAVTSSVQAGPIGIFEYSAFINSSGLGPESLQDTQIGSGFSDFAGAGLDVFFANGLDADNLGTVSWKVTNNTGADLFGVQFFGLLDAEIDEGRNSFFNENGNAAGLALGAGSADSLPDSWEIDEPGFVFGDIFDNLLAGSLDNTNGVAAGLEDDVALALGFEVADFLAGNVLTATFEIALLDSGGLNHFDPDSDYGFYFNGSIQQRGGAPVPVPGTLGLFVAVLGLLKWSRRSSKVAHC